MKRHASNFGKVAKPPSVANPLKRKNHKEALRLNAKDVAQNKAHPEPMSFIHKRQKNLDQGLFDPQRDITLGSAEKVAHAVADWELSDPFAFGRTFLHAKKGLLDPLKLSEEMHMRTVARKAAKVKAVEDAKKRGDLAWEA